MPRPFLLLPVLLLLSSAAAAQSAQWRSGPTVYTPACEIFFGGCQPNGTGFFVSQAYIPTPPQPVVGQRFYVALYLQGIVTMPRFMDIHFIPPAGTRVVADPVDRVFCYYGNRQGGALQNFTGAPVHDVYDGSTLTIAGCPQPAASGAPYAIVPVPICSAYRLDRRNGPSTLWPMPSGASYLFYIPLVADVPLDGVSDAARLIAPIHVAQADLLGPQWAYPRLPLVAYAPGSGGGVPPAPAQADLQTTLTRSESATTTTLIGRCRNAGPAVASGVDCVLDGLPDGVAASCSPAGTQPTLAVDAAIECRAQFATPRGALAVALSARAATDDPTPGNDAVVLEVGPLLRDGFEDP